MQNTKYVLERFRKIEDYPEATEDMLVEYLNDLLNSSANNPEEAYEVLVEYLDYLNVDPDSFTINNQNGHFEVDFAD